MGRMIGRLLLVSLLLALPAWGAESRTGWTATPSVGWQMFEGNQYLEDRPVGGLAFGYDYSGGWSLEGAGTYVDTYRNRGGRGRGVDVYTLRVDVLKHFMAERRLVPYLVAGIGALQTVEKTPRGEYKDEDPLFAYGVGLKYYLPENVALRLDLRHHIDYTGNDHWEDHDWYNNAALTFGITVPLGRKNLVAPPPAPAEPVAAPAPVVEAEAVAPPVTESVAVADSDGDGVADLNDRCPATPAGTVVDAAGCPGDSDGDGIDDNRDRCEVTPGGTPVDESGCPRQVWQDADGDGVSDGNDRCPNTPAPVPVNPYGCPRDSDGDTVFDVDDQCPDTPQGAAVNGAGCPVAASNPLSAALEAEKRGLRLNILFAEGKTEIPSKYQKELAAAAAYLNSNPQGRYVVEGHTDSVGNEKANRALSERRAQSVRSYLIKNHKIEPDRLEARGLGESRPLGDNATKEGRTLNRRVVLVPLAP